LRGADVGAKGTFTGLTGKLVYDELYLDKSSVEVNIPIATFKTDEKKRDTTMVGAKFFDCPKFPEAKFRSQSVSRSHRHKMIVDGVLELHGLKHPVQICIDSLPGTVKKDGHRSLTVNGFCSLNQQDFDLDLVRVHPDGFVRVNDQIGVHVTLHATQ
jgi:polyisoprenoid-binding protein YceI